MSRAAEIAEEIAVLMPRIARRILLEFLQSIEITQSQLFTLLTLAEKEGCRLSDLSQIMGISAPTVTGIIDRLEKMEYVKRVPDDQDRRAINIHLTEKGSKLVRKLRGIIKDRWQEIIEKLPADDGEHYVRILRKVQELI